jgi:hypothetical protein
VHVTQAAPCDGQDEEQAKWEAEKAAQAAKLRRDKLTLEKQSRALLKLPTKKERSEVGHHLALMLLIACRQCARRMPICSSSLVAAYPWT